jgi:DNA-binding response OmpR family regulator
MRKHETTTNSPAILIIDDDSPTQELYSGVLRNHYRVFVCSTQQEALDTLSQETLHLVVLEPSIAGSDGWSFLSSIVHNYSVPVIVCSSSDDRKSGMNAGAEVYLIKPVLPHTLLEVSKNVLSKLRSFQRTDDENLQ